MLLSRHSTLDVPAFAASASVLRSETAKDESAEWAERWAFSASNRGALRHRARIASDYRRVPNVSINATNISRSCDLNPFSNLLSHFSLLDSRFFAVRVGYADESITLSELD